MLPLLFLPLLLPLTITASPSPSALTSSCSTSFPSCSTPPFLNLLQSWDPESTDSGAWLIQALEIESCDDGKRLKSCSTDQRVFSSEKIMSAVERSSSRGEVEESEAEWMVRSTGEGVEEVWERAWSVSGTCLSTMDPSCDPSGTVAKGMEVAPFFQLAHRIHTALPVAKILEDADMIPSEDITYSLLELTQTLHKATSYHPLLLCIEGNSLSTISWPIELLAGSDRWTPEFGPRSLESLKGSEGRKSNCPEEGIVLHPSLLSIIRRRKPQPTHTWDPIMRPSPRHLKMPTSTVEEEEEEPTPRLGFFNKAQEKREKVQEGRDAVVGRRVARDEL
ncbi:ribonuclease T2-like protein [Mrakia frigida]|uniref:ribonuclease T2-like protein n=1 Tax=Mrakia frigida TaxID=29902 RepID=UPI003FCC203E